LVEKAYTRHLQEGTEPSEGDLLELLRTMSRRMAATFFILEAIDEASEKIQIDLIKKLASLDVRLFITSRPLQAIEAKLPDAHAISIMAHKEDLDLHIAERFENVVTLHGLQECDPELKQQIVTAVKSKCGEMCVQMLSHAEKCLTRVCRFLHASLQLDALQLCSSPHDVLMTLQSFPSQIEKVYMQTWNRIVDSTPHHISLAKAALVWVLNAQRSMTIDELRYALATHPVTHNFESTRLIHETTFMAIFRGLIVVDPRSMLVRLVRKSSPVDLGLHSAANEREIRQNSQEPPRKTVI
jgi:ankyrin repeat domain-containing protein 50